MEKESNFQSQDNQTQPWETQTDEALCRQAQQGVSSAAEQLLRRYERLVRVCIRPYYMMGADKEDLIQEGMIGLYQAIGRFDARHGVAFSAFARHCILHSVYSAVRRAASGKQAPLNTSVSMGKSLFDENACDYVSMSPDAADPESLVIDREECSELKRRLVHHLSKFEAKVLERYLYGDSYAEIADELGKPVKAVDNAIQRIRRKAAELSI